MRACVLALYSFQSVLLTGDLLDCLRVDIAAFASFQSVLLTGDLLDCLLAC